MKSLTTTMFIIILAAFGLNAQPFMNGSHLSEKKVIVEEVIQVPGYTYVYATEKDKKVWFAVPTMDAKKGDVYYYDDPMRMTNFESKELNRKFEEILFIGAFTPEKTETEKEEIIKSSHAGNASKKDTSLNISPVENGITIMELLSNKEKYAGKMVTIKGSVTKYNEKILYFNWIHLQDGTEYKGEFDLTITTKQKAQIGDTLSIHGMVSLDRDFGYGYFFPVIIEDATISK